MVNEPRCNQAALGLIALSFLALSIVATLPLVNWLRGLSWHDQQRIGQIILFAVAGAFLLPASLLRLRFGVVDSTSRGAIAAILVLGLISSMLSHQPFWAFAELSLAAGSLGIGYVAAMARARWGGPVDRALIGLVYLVCTAFALQFVVRYVAAFTSGTGLLDVWMLLEGFSNPRFYGQFLSLTLPILAVPLVARGDVRRYALPAAVLMVLMWTIAVASGTRATWIGLAAAGVWLSMSGAGGRRWMAWNALAALAGVAIFWLSMQVIPEWAGMRTANAAARLTTSLSLREVLWQQAYEMIVARPLLGHGPMHFSDMPNPVAAHPHQAWLQWAAEWGIPSAVLVTWLVVRAARIVFRTLRTQPAAGAVPGALRVCLAGALAASLTHAMVDGVLVMPYSQIWLALISGWLLGMHRSEQPLSPGSLPWRAGFGATVLLAVCVLGATASRDFPHLFERERLHAATFGGHLQPRFWKQGVIAELPDR